MPTKFLVIDPPTASEPESPTMQVAPEFEPEIVSPSEIIPPKTRRPIKKAEAADKKKKVVSKKRGINVVSPTIPPQAKTAAFELVKPQTEATAQAESPESLPATEPQQEAPSPTVEAQDRSTMLPAIVTPPDPRMANLRDIVTGKAAMVIPSWLYMVFGFLCAAYVTQVIFGLLGDYVSGLPPWVPMVSKYAQLSFVGFAMLSALLGCWRSLEEYLRRKFIREIARNRV